MKINLRRLLEKKQITQTELCEVFQISKSQMSQIIGGSVNFPYKYRSVFCEIMEIDFEAFSRGVILPKDKKKKLTL